MLMSIIIRENSLNQYLETSDTRTRSIHRYDLNNEALWDLMHYYGNMAK